MIVKIEFKNGDVYYNDHIEFFNYEDQVVTLYDQWQQRMRFNIESIQYFKTSDKEEFMQ